MFEVEGKVDIGNPKEFLNGKYIIFNEKRI